ncbi:MAG: MFS transporter, partial [Spirulinaceae cyanobacterium]
PVSLSILGLITLIFDANVGANVFNNMEILFVGVIVLKFFDELLRYTLIAGIEPALFQPIPERIRGSIQTRVQGIAEPLSTGVTGLGILGVVWFVNHKFGELSETAARQVQGGIFIGAIVVFSIIWAISAWLLRSSYVSLLVQSAEQGRLGFLSVDLKAFKKAILEALQEKEAEADKLSCIQLLERIDPPGVGEVLAPLLVNLSPALQRESLGAMVKYPDQELRPYVQKIVEQKPNLDVLALALRYMWLSQPDLDTNTLIPYLNEKVDPIVRGTAASLILRRGNPYEKSEATNTLERMLSSKRERERAIGIKALQEVDYMPLFAKRYLSELLQDESARVRCALLEMIGVKHLETYYPSLVKGLYYRSTREAARNALVYLGDDGIQIFADLTEDIRKPDMVRLQGWNALAQIATPKALTQLVQQLMSNWGGNRRSILRILLKIPGDLGIEAVLEQLGRSGVETMIEQELLLLGQVYSASIDFDSELVVGREANLLRSALKDLQSDIMDRCFLLMKLLYPASAIQAAMFNLNSDSQANIALGLEILDNTLDLPTKGVFLELLDRGTTESKLIALESLLDYQPMKPPDRLRHLVEFRHFLSDWSLACCFYLARQAHWSISKEATLVCLGHPSAFVREAVLVYLREASPRTCSELLSVLKNDPNPLVAAQVQQIIGEMGHPTAYKT